MFGLFKPRDLWSAAKRGDVKGIEQLVANGHDLNARKTGFFNEGFTPLHLAVLHQQKEAIRALVKLGADIEAKNNEGERPLWAAVSKPTDPDIVELLLDLGAKVNSRKRDLSMTALDWASFDGNLKMVLVLLKRGANPNAGSGKNRSAPIQQCAHNGSVEILNALLKAGADVNAVDADWTALGTAAISGHTEFVQMLLNAGANPNQADVSGTTPLFCAVAGKELVIVRMLAEAGGNLNAVRFRGNAETPLDFTDLSDKKGRAIAEYFRSVGAKRAVELPEAETTPPPERKSGTFWQLQDDSVVEVTLEPWPPRPGLAKIKVEVSPNGHDPSLPFTGILDYRLSFADDSTGSWTAMKRGRRDAENCVHFSASTELAKGTMFIQFKIQPEWEKSPTILKDWKIEA
jgi:ankyrin repeat protein